MLYLVLSSLATARLVNITVDDTNPDPLTGATFTYSPADRWARGNGCEPCLAKLDPTKVHDATWHDASYVPGSSISANTEVQTAILPFNGSAFYVYGVLSQSSKAPYSTADITFSIDGQYAGNFTYTPSGIPDSYLYDYLLWYNDSLTLGQHTFSLENGRPGGNLSLILLDYVIYTRDDGIPDPSTMSSTTSSSSAQSSSTSAVQTPPPNTNDKRERTIIIACVIPVGLVAIAAAAFALSRCHYKRKARQQAQWDHDSRVHDEHSGVEVTPFVAIEGTPGQRGDVSRVSLSGSSIPYPMSSRGYPDPMSQLPSGLLQSSEIINTKGDGHESPPAYYDSALQVPTAGR